MPTRRQVPLRARLLRLLRRMSRRAAGRESAGEVATAPPAGSSATEAPQPAREAASASNTAVVEERIADHAIGQADHQRGAAAEYGTNDDAAAESAAVAEAARQDGLAAHHHAAAAAAEGRSAVARPQSDSPANQSDLRPINAPRTARRRGRGR